MILGICLYMIINAIMYIGTFEPTFSPLFKKLALITTANKPISEEIEDIFRSFAQTIQTTAPIIVGIGISAI